MFRLSVVASALDPDWTGRDMKHRRGFKQTETLQDTLARFAIEMRERAEALPAGIEREQLLKRARNADTTAHLDDWASSPGLQAPT